MKTTIEYTSENAGKKAILTGSVAAYIAPEQSENTNAATKAVFDFLRENYGKNVIAAQQMFSQKAYEDAVYYGVTGDLPAMKGFDLLFVGMKHLALRILRDARASVKEREER